MMLSLSFTPDGGKSMHSLTFNANTLRVYLIAVLALLLMVTLSLVKVYELAMAVVGFFLMASPESLMRLFLLIAVLVLLPFLYKAWRSVPGGKTL